MRSDYPSIIGKIVCGKVDRPLGSRHPQHPEMVYPINYGYVENVYAEDGAEQDIYLIGVNFRNNIFEGNCCVKFQFNWGVIRYG